MLWQVLQVMGNMWRALAPDERKVYELEAERAKVRRLPISNGAACCSTPCSATANKFWSGPRVVVRSLCLGQTPVPCWPCAAGPLQAVCLAMRAKHEMKAEEVAAAQNAAKQPRPTPNRKGQVRGTQQPEVRLHTQQLENRRLRERRKQRKTGRLHGHAFEGR